MALSMASVTTNRPLRWAAWGLGLVTLVLRLAFPTDPLFDHDSVQFALGVEHYDLAAHHPHPPGYPVYIALIRRLVGFGLDPAEAMVWLSVLGGALGAVAMVYLAARLARPATAAGGDDREPLVAGVVAGLLFAVHPHLWFYGELPLLYGLEGGLAPIVALVILRMPRGGGAQVLATFSFALVAGLRQSTAVFLAPLFVYGLVLVWRTGRLSLLRFLGLAAGGACVVGVWALPLVINAGGLAAYRALSAEHFGTLLPQTSILYGAGVAALAHNLEVLTKWTLQGLVPGLALLAVAWSSRAGRAGSTRRLLPALGFLALWVVPPVSFFLLFHVTKAGYTLVYQPALLVAVALAAAPALAADPRRRSIALGLAAALGAGLFVFGRDRAPDSPRALALVRHEFNAGTLRRFERDLGELTGALVKLPADRVVLVALELEGTGGAGARGFLYPWHRHLQWYMPEHETVLLAPDAGFALWTRGHVPFTDGGRQVPVPPGVERLVFVTAAPPGERFPLPLGEVLVANPTFYVVSCPLPADRRVGGFHFREIPLEFKGVPGAVRAPTG